jgi:YggT family protein
VTQTLLMLVQTLGGLYLAVCLLRILLQAVRADYYNPISQAIVAATNLPIRLLRPVFPNLGRLDLAALAWTLLFALAVVQLSAVWARLGWVPPLLSLYWALLGAVNLLLSMLFWGLIAVIVFSWLTALGNMNLRHPAIDLLNQLMLPVMRPLQRIIPSFGGIDLSPILLFILLQVAQTMVRQAAIGASLRPGLVLGF